MIRLLLVWLMLAAPAAALEADGPFDIYDGAQLRRGLEVYEQVCSACHGLRHVTIRSLAEPDGPALDDAAMRERAAALDLAPTDRFPASALPEAPDLSLMAKQHPGGAAFIHAVLTGYDGTEADGLWGNRAAGPIAMPPPLVDGIVTYEDGTDPTVEQMSQDVSAFLAWAADPQKVARKRSGFVAVGLMILLAGLLWLTNREVWRRQPR
ncbi:cytochrome c1 [Falsirhodobacter algicola]|uniref:Cytochrome c1 n=1 Tax=Falsirhodobacter algicola TaxID=2692330 RepID=A0A8J8SLD2_9RHOB|nr:cytochrome c1 [Falsirhodobacter algicola]QUS36388.1 cytochrome c1 [Falsirhodobacter algicola]